MAIAVYSLAADDDLDGIVEYIARDRPEAARDWLAKLKATCQMLAENPNVGEVRVGFGVPECRSFSVGRYVIFFRSSAGGIEVARIIDGSRNL